MAMHPVCRPPALNADIQYQANKSLIVAIRQSMGMLIALRTGIGSGHMQRIFNIVDAFQNEPMGSLKKSAPLHGVDSQRHAAPVTSRASPDTRSG